MEETREELAGYSLTERQKVITELAVDILLEMASFSLFLLPSCECSLRWEMLSHRCSFWYATALAQFCLLLSLISLS